MNLVINSKPVYSHTPSHISDNIHGLFNDVVSRTRLYSVEWYDELERMWREAVVA
jgi:hypothetical protein